MLGVLIVPASASLLPFTDVSTSSAYYNAIKYIYENGYMVGTTDTTFSPNSGLTRGMFVTILYNLSGSTMKRAPTGFTDVPSSKYYYYPVGWAQYYGVISGYSETSFKPDEYITKEMVLAILYKFATAYLGNSYTLISDSYSYDLSDCSSINSNFRTGVNWALNCGIVDPSTTNLYPKNNATRVMCAQYIYKMNTVVLGNAKSYAMTDLSVSTTTLIAELFEDSGYNACIGYDLTPREMEFALYNSALLYTHSHGAANFIKLSNGNLYASDIDNAKMTDMKLAYISACYAGTTFAKDLCENGYAQASIGLTGTVSAVTNSDGIHEFNYRVLYHYLYEGLSIKNAIEKAQNFMYSVYGKYSGSDTCVYYTS